MEQNNTKSNSNVGGYWLSNRDGGNGFIKMTIEGKEYKFGVSPNKFKKPDNKQPDYQLYAWIENGGGNNTQKAPTKTTQVTSKPAVNSSRPAQNTKPANKPQPRSQVQEVPDDESIL